MHLGDVIDVILTILRKLATTHPRLLIEEAGAVVAFGLALTGFLVSRLSG